MMNGKNSSAEVPKNLLQLDTDLKIILLDHQNNYVESSNWWLECQNFLQYSAHYA